MEIAKGLSVADVEFTVAPLGFSIVSGLRIETRRAYTKGPPESPKKV
jgi:hypothetical protein